MKWSDILPALAKLAPTIASAAGGPLAGTAVSAIEGALGLNKTAGTNLTDQQDQVAEAIAGATPQQLLDLKKADQDFQVQMASLGFKDAEELASLDFQDRDSARKLEEDTKDVTPKLLAWGVTAGFFSILFLILFHKVPDTSSQVFDILLGSLGTAWVSIISYYFGSSATSQHQSKLLSQSTPNASAPAVKK